VFEVQSQYDSLNIKAHSQLGLGASAKETAVRERFDILFVDYKTMSNENPHELRNKNTFLSNGISGFTLRKESGSFAQYVPFSRVEPKRDRAVIR
jgi:hypothetical protein